VLVFAFINTILLVIPASRLLCCTRIKCNINVEPSLREFSWPALVGLPISTSGSSFHHVPPRPPHSESVAQHHDMRTVRSYLIQMLATADYFKFVLESLLSFPDDGTHCFLNTRKSFKMWSPSSTQNDIDLSTYQAVRWRSSPLS
jgi:hypothetical protein